MSRILATSPQPGDIEIVAKYHCETTLIVFSLPESKSISENDSDKNLQTFTTIFQLQLYFVDSKIDPWVGGVAKTLGTLYGYCFDLINLSSGIETVLQSRTKANIKPMVQCDSSLFVFQRQQCWQVDTPRSNDLHQHGSQNRVQTGTNNSLVRQSVFLENGGFALTTSKFSVCPTFWILFVQ